LDQVDNTSDATKNAATATLTNKTLTTPRIDAIKDINGAVLIASSVAASAVNYLTVRNNASGGEAAVYAGGPDTNIDLSLYAKGGSGYGVNLRSTTNGVLFRAYGVTGGINRVDVYNSATGNAPYFIPSGADTNIGLNLRSKGTGTVQANGVEVTTISSAQTLTNKTISGMSNTLSNIPFSAVPALSAVSGSGANEISAGDMENADLIKQSAPNRVLSTEQKLTGTQSLKLTGYNYAFFPHDISTGAVQTNPCAPGDVVSAEACVYGHASNQDTSETLYLRIDFLKSDGSWSNYYTKPLAAGNVLTGTWTKMSLSYIAPATTVGYAITVYQLYSSTTVPGNVYYWDGIRATKSMPTMSGRLVGTTVVGGAGTEDGGATWTKIAEYTMGTSYVGQSAILNVSQIASSNEQAVIGVHIRSQGVSQTHLLNVEFISKPSATAFITTNSFKLISTGATYDAPVELWFRKNANSGQFAVYEMSSYRGHQYNGKKYYFDTTWQSAIPTGTAEVTSGPQTSFGAPIATTTDIQTITNKTLTNPKTNAIFDTAGGVAMSVTATGGTNYLTLTNSTGNPGFTVSSVNTDQSMFVAPKGAGTFRIYVASGQTPTLTGAGADTNHNLNLQS
ncbi:hypothetical protein KC953_03630, partial [Candidatus Saccharibacteria bacterium]|nr:hypothetical protein [Candidatus Saccharibacteria bacterium]